MLGIPLPVDILVATPEDLEKHKDNIGLIYKSLVRRHQGLSTSRKRILAALLSALANGQKTSTKCHLTRYYRTF